MPALIEAGRAKVNLTLRVVGRRVDGFHDLESVVAFADCADRLTLEPGPELSLSMAGPLADACGDTSDNLVLKAARLLGERVADLEVGHFTLEKVLPVAAGIGGGSADAAAALRLLARLNELSLDDSRIMEVALQTGADVPLTHPDHAWFSDLELRWHALPVISDAALHLGGATFGCVPFNGWYMQTEIAARNLTDETRYNLLPRVAAALGLDTRHERTLWRDRALLELNVAVLHSFRQAGVKIVDHHSAARERTGLDHPGKLGRGQHAAHQIALAFIISASEKRPSRSNSFISRSATARALAASSTPSAKVTLRATAAVSLSMSPAFSALR